MSIIKQVAAGAGADTLLNEINRALGPAALYGIKDIAGLNLSLYGSPFNGVNVTDQTVALTASSTNYVVANRATGAVTVATATTNWNDQTTYMRLYQIVAGTSTMTIAVDSDKRQAYGAGTGTTAAAGADTQIQYNNGGVLGGDADFAWDATNNRLNLTNLTATGLVLTAASGAGSAGFRLPHGAAPSAPVDGDVWTTSAGLYARINGANVGPYATAAGSLTNPMSAVGDLILGGTVTGGVAAPARLAAGSNGQVLTVVGGAPAWATATGGATDPTIALGSLTKWAAAKARGSTNPARFAFFGDSNVAGQGTGTGTNNLTGAASTSMARKFATLAGFQIESFFAEQNVLGASGSVNGYDPRIALGSGWAGDTVPNTFGGRFLKSTAAPAGRLTFTPAAAFSKFRLWYPTASGANTAMTVYVDGTLVDTINQVAASSFTFKDYTVTAGTHVIGIGGGATGTAFVAGIQTFDGTSSPVIMQGGWCGAKVADLNGATDPWSFRNAMATMAPDFSVVYCTINDATAKTLGNAYYAALEALVKAASASSDGCLCLGYPANQVGTNDGYYDALTTSLKNLAADYGWFFYDTRRVFGRSYARAVDKGYNFDTLHPNKTGSDAMATDLFNFLSAAGL